MTDLFKWRHYESEIILTCVRWYLRYALSYRDLAEMMTERGLSVDHSTIFRLVQNYAPEIDKRTRHISCSGHISSKRTILGELTKPTSTFEASGCISIELLTQRARPSISS
jgi:hypothetical protein